MLEPSPPRLTQRSASGASRKPLLDTLLDVLDVNVAAQRELFQRLMVAQARRRVLPQEAEAAVRRAFEYHAMLTDAALGVVNAIHASAPVQGEAPAAAFDKSVLSLGFTSVARWTDRLTCSPMRHAARLMLSPEQMELLMQLLEDANSIGAGDDDDGEEDFDAV